MAFNWKTFQTRTLTAIVFVAVMLTGLLWNYWSFLLLFSIVHFGCWWEYFNLTEKMYDTVIEVPTTRLLMMITGYIIFLSVGVKGEYDFFFKIGEFEISIKWLFYLVLFGLLLIYLLKNPHNPVKAKLILIGGFIYISLSWGLMLNLYSDLDIIKSNSKYLLPSAFFPILIIATIWINDTMAYIVGSVIGKTPMSKISPKKTWEGTFGGIVLSVIVIGSVAVFILKFGAFTYHILNITVIAAVMGTFGDLLESKFKRMADVKDSGHIMPGHGGFLDRFDSLLLATPFVWLYVRLFIV